MCHVLNNPMDTRLSVYTLSHRQEQSECNALLQSRRKKTRLE